MYRFFDGSYMRTISIMKRLIRGDFFAVFPCIYAVELFTIRFTVSHIDESACVAPYRGGKHDSGNRNSAVAYMFAKHDYHTVISYRIVFAYCSYAVCIFRH